MAVDVNQLNSYLTSTVPTSEARGEGTPIEVIPPPGESASVPTGTDGTVPIEVEQPPQVDQALYQIEFHRKIYGASVDVLETLERITYVDSYTDSTMRLNIAYIKFWKRGNTRPAGESTTVSGPDYQFGKINDTELVFQDIARVPDNVFVPNNVSVDQASPGWKTITDPATILGTLPSPQTSNTTKSEPEVNTEPSSAAPAPNYSSGEALQYVFDDANIYRFIDNGDINTTDYGSIALSNTALTIDRNAGNLQLFVPSNDLPQTKPTLPSTREEALSKIRAELETAKAATPPDQDLITYLEQTLAKVEQSSPEQYEQGLDLPPDPRQQIPTYESPTTERVQVADVIGGMSENYSRYDPEKKTEKTEGIWQFLFNPQTLERSFGPEYKEANTWGNSEGNPMHFSGFKNEELRFRDILLNGYMFGRKVESLIEGIRDLVSVDVAEGHQSPRVLEFIWGSKTFGPCIMTDISVNEEMWDGGEVVNARLSFTLKKIPEWVINDEYVNIFSPSGQPLQMIIIQPEKPADSAGDTNGVDSSSDGGGGEVTTTAEQKEAEKLSPSCTKFHTYCNGAQSFYNGSIVASINKLNKSKSNDTISLHQFKNQFDSFIIWALDDRTKSPYKDNPILKARKQKLDDSIRGARNSVRNLLYQSGQGNPRELTGTKSQMSTLLGAVNSDFSSFLRALEIAAKDYGCKFTPKIRGFSAEELRQQAQRNTENEKGDLLDACRSLRLAKFQASLQQLENLSQVGPDSLIQAFDPKYEGIILNNLKGVYRHLYEVLTGVSDVLGPAFKTELESQIGNQSITVRFGNNNRLKRTIFCNGNASGDAPGEFGSPNAIDRRNIVPNIYEKCIKNRGYPDFLSRLRDRVCGKPSAPTSSSATTPTRSGTSRSRSTGNNRTNNR